MASQPESKIPGPTGGKEKRRSFLPAPKRSSGIPAPSFSASSVAADPPAPVVKLPPSFAAAPKKESPKEDSANVEEVIPGAEKLTVGGRILISGVKPGILRFVGKTCIAPGYWCGVELFDASGLHDGEVDGKRYFTCKPFRGIFAPLDKVVPDESHQSPPVVEEEPAKVPEKVPDVKHEEPKASESTDKPTPVEHESSKIRGPYKSQIARPSGIPRIGSGAQDRGVVKSTSADGIKETSKLATLFKRYSGLDASAASNADLNSTFTVDEVEAKRSRRLSADSDPDGLPNQTYSCNVEQHLKSDSRQYLNITFNKDSLPALNIASNLPDVVSSASPSPPKETASRVIPGTLNQTYSAQDISAASDSSLGLMEPDIITDETNLLDGVLSDRVAPSTSESDVSLSGNSSTLEDTSVATVNEVTGPCLNSTPLHGVDLKKFVDENGENLSDNLSDVESVKSVSTTCPSSVKQSLAQAFVRSEESAQRKDSTSSINGVSAVRADLLQEEGSNGVSPEVSQVLEWDYDHDAFDGKLLEKCQDGMSTSTSDSCSEASADQGAVLAEKGIPDVDMPVQDGDEIPPFEETEDGFESIDNIDDFPLGMSKDTQHLMTDSGISEKGFLDPGADAASKRKSVEFDNRVSVVDHSGEGDVVVERRMAVDANLRKDLMDGHAKQERPLSLVSTTSADTGYVPDTDSEAGTLTTNSPTDWMEKQLNAAGLAGAANADSRQRVLASVKTKQSLGGGGLTTETVPETEADSGTRSDAGCNEAKPETEGKKPSIAEETNKTARHSESADSEGEEEEQEEEDECSEEETSSEEEEEDEGEAGDDRPEDDRVEADRAAPCAPTRTLSQADSVVSDGAPDALPPPPLPPSQPAAEGADGSDMTESTNLTISTTADLGVVVTNEMTESAEPVSVSSPRVTADGSSGEAPTTKPEPEMSAGQPQADDGPVTTKPTGEEESSSNTNQTPKKKRAASTSADKKTAAEHKRAVKSASSRLADYIKTTPPSKPKEEKKTESKSKKNNTVGDAKTNKTAGKKQDNGSNSAADKSKGEISEEKKEKKPTPVKEEKPKVKRTSPKSKWGNIMSQIEASKDSSPKPKAKTEVKSSIAAYVSTPATPSNINTSLKKEAGEKDKAKQKEETPKPKPKSKLVKHPKPDFSNIKSKLSIPSPPKQTDHPRDASVSPNRGSPKDSDNAKDSKNAKNSISRTALQKKTPVSRLVKGKLHVDRQEDLDNWSTMSQGTGSYTDLSVFDSADGTSPSLQPLSEKKRNALSCAGPRQKNERSSSIASTKSDISSAQRSVKATNLRNAQKSDSPAGNTSFSKKSAVKSSIPPPTRKGTNTTSALVSPNKGAAGDASPSSFRSKSSPPKIPSPKPGTGVAGAATTAANTRSPLQRVAPSGPNQQNRSRNKGSSGLKSGQPPDVVSTSARGSRAQEVARLESLCESRTKELNYTKMQLKAGLQAFDAMSCLLNYCTNQLDAFSCPVVTAKLQTAEGKIVEQQQNIELLSQQKQELNQQLQEVLGARDAAQQEVTKIKEEMVQADEAHKTAQEQLKEEHAAALKTLEEELNSQHQKASQQMQKCQEKQAEYTRQTHKRQLTEMTAEHQMFTNQLKLAHLEEIQELRNKHDLQMEELHAQHRNKLEDITRRFESIKLSLSEKVQSLCVECDELRVRAKTSEEALQRDADVKVQLALAPYLHLPNEIESLKMVIDMRTEEIQKLRRHNMDLEKQLEELPIAQEKVASLQQKVENLQAIINIKTDHEKQLHEKCQVLMRKYDRESRANKRLSMDYEQVVWRMSQSADLTGSVESLSARQMSHSPGRGEDRSQHSSPSPVRRSHSNVSKGGDSSDGSPSGVARRQRKVSSGEEDCERKIRCRSATFSLDKSKARQSRSEAGLAINGTGSSPGSPSKQLMARSADYAEMIVAAMNADQDESFSSGHESGEMSDFQSSMESSVILETPQGLSYNISVVENGSAVTEDRQDEVFVMEDISSSLNEKSIPRELQHRDVENEGEVTVIVSSPATD